MNNVDLLKAIGDINDEYLDGEYERKEVKQKSSNLVRDSFKHMKLKYIATPIFTLAIITISIFSISKLDNINNSIELGENSILSEVNKGNDNIIFNDYSVEISSDVDGKWVDADIKSRFSFINELNIPEGYTLKRQGEIYQKENLKDTDYTKLYEYCVMYSKPLGNSLPNSTIEITFTKEEKIVTCMPLNENTIPSSIINEYEVKLFKSKYIKEAIFEYSGYKFYIDTYQVNEYDFINIIKSILN